MERQICGPQWGDPPQKLEGNKDFPSDEEEPCFVSENENLSWGDYMRIEMPILFPLDLYIRK